MTYVYTDKAEARARELGLDERRAGDKAMLGNRPLDDAPRDIREAWIARGYVEEVADGAETPEGAE